MTKPMLVTLPFILLLLDYWFLKRFEVFGKINKAFAIFGEKVPFLVFSAAISLLTFLSQRDAGAVSSFDVFPLSVRISNAALSYLTYMGRMFWPEKLAFFYPYSDNLVWWQITGAVILLVLITFFAIRDIRSCPWFIVGWLWYLGMLFPVIGIAQVGLQSMADRYTYVPSVEFFIIVSWGSHRLLKKFIHRKIIFSVGGTVLLIILGICSKHQFQYWRNDVTLFTHALKVTAQNHAAHNNLGLALFREGRLKDAATHFYQAIKIGPESLVYRTNLGEVLAKQGQFDDAIEQLTWVADRVPSYTGANYNLGILYFKQGEFEKAKKCFEQVEKFEPDSAEVHFQLGRVMVEMGQYDKSISYFREAVTIKPDCADAKKNIEIISGKIAKNSQK